MPKRERIASGDHTLTWSRKVARWTGDQSSDSDSEQDQTEWENFYWDDEGLWVFYGDDWWIQEDGGWWRRWGEEQRPTMQDVDSQCQSTGRLADTGGSVDDLMTSLVGMELMD